MKKTFLSILLTSIILSSAGCNVKTQTVTHTAPDTSSIGIIASKKETVETVVETSKEEDINERIVKEYRFRT